MKSGCLFLFEVSSFGSIVDFFSFFRLLSLGRGAGFFFTSGSSQGTSFLSTIRFLVLLRSGLARNLYPSLLVSLLALNFHLIVLLFFVSAGLALQSEDLC